MNVTRVCVAVQIFGSHAQTSTGGQHAPGPPNAPDDPRQRPAARKGRAREWYADKRGFTTDQEAPEALVYQGVGDRLFLLFSSYSAGTAQHQLAAWVVEDLEAEVTELRGRGVVFEEYD